MHDVAAVRQLHRPRQRVHVGQDGQLLLAEEDQRAAAVDVRPGGLVLAPGGPGRTMSPEDFGPLMHDLERRIFDVYDDDTWFYPGHGNDSTLGAERPHLGEWRARGW